MRWLDNLLGRKGISYDWTADPLISPLYNFDTHRFCQTALRGNVETLAHLGPSDNKQDKQSAALSYRALGLDVLYNYETNQLEGMVFAFADAILGNYLGGFRWQGRTFTLGRGQRTADIIAIFGQPYWQEQETKLDTVLYYEWPNDIEAQFAFEDGHLASIEVSIFPELADPEFRREMGITAPWPGDA